MEDIKHISSGSTDHNNRLLIFAGIAVKLEIVGPTFSTFIHFYFRLSQQWVFRCAHAGNLHPGEPIETTTALPRTQVLLGIFCTIRSARSHGKDEKWEARFLKLSYDPSTATNVENLKKRMGTRWPTAED